MQAADKAGFKYVWVTEHHFLDEYSHLSANDVVLGYLAHATERIHLGSGIFNPLAQVNHPAKVAERVAMLDHLSDGRFEFGTGPGRGQPRDPGLSAPGRDHRHIGHQGDLGRDHRRVRQDVAAGRVPGVRGQVVVAPAPQDPAQALEEAPPGDVVRGGQHRRAMPWPPARAWASSGSRWDRSTSLAPVLEAYKTEIANAEPVGAFVNDNIMVTTAAYVAEDRRDRPQMRRPPGTTATSQSNVYRYHDTFPHPPQVPLLAGAGPGRHPRRAGCLDGGRRHHRRSP